MNNTGWMEMKADDTDKRTVYVLTFRDAYRLQDDGIYNAVFSTLQKAIAAWNELIEREISDGCVDREDIRIISTGYARTVDERYTWIVNDVQLDSMVSDNMTPTNSNEGLK